MRADQLLVERGVAPSRSAAQRLIARGGVRVRAASGWSVPKKAGEELPDAAEIEVVDDAELRFVSRGGLKLDAALARCAIDVAGFVCLDVGQGTGGFTDVLLQRGASHVIALDVGYGQLHPRLRNDPRVTVLERTNARAVDSFPYAPDLVTCDVSFISVKTALPPALRLAAPGFRALVLIKPQFEAGRAEAPKGVVRDPAVRRAVLRDVAEAALGWRARVAGVVDSGLPGPKGNHEFVLHLVHAERPELPAELDRWIADAAG